MNPTCSSRSVLSFLAVAGLACGAASAQPYCSFITRYNIPDFDQRRDAAAGVFGLPNGGVAYCVPTACIDHMAYMANHGYPTAVHPAYPGPRAWNDASGEIYNMLGAAIQTMGGFMATDPVDGTSGYTEGLKAWCALRLPNDSVNIFSTALTPTQSLPDAVEDMAQAMSMGWLVNLHIGWWASLTFGGVTAYERTGGHAVALSGIDNACSGSPTLRWRDPSSGDSTFSQSAFTGSASSATKVTEFLSWADDPDFRYRTTWRLNAYSGAAFIGGAKFISPNFGAGILSSTVKIHIPKSFKLLGGAETQTITIAPSFGIPRSFELSSSMLLGSVIAQPAAGGPARLLAVKMGDGSVNQVHVFTGAAGPMASGNDGELYITDGTSLTALDPKTGIVRLTGPPQCAVDDLVFEDPSGELIGLNIAQKRLDRYEHAGLKIRRSDLLPAAVALDSDATLAINPVTGKIWINPGTGSGFYEVTYPASGGPVTVASETLPGVTNPRGLQFTSKGDALVNDGGVIEELSIDPRSGRYASSNRTGMSGQAFGGEFRMATSRSTYDPATIDLFEDFKQLPSQSLDCLADLNDDGIVDFADYLEFLNRFDTGDLSVDFTADGIVDFADYLEFLNLFDAGC